MCVSLNRSSFGCLIGILCAVNPDLIHLEELQPHLRGARLEYENCYMPPVAGYRQSHIPDDQIRGIREPPVAIMLLDE